MYLGSEEITPQPTLAHPHLPLFLLSLVLCEHPTHPPAHLHPPTSTRQDEPFETPMQPITMLRNALGREEGGSGVPLDKQKYADSVAYWEEHATIVDGAKPNGE